MFTGGSIYGFIISKKIIYHPKITKTSVVVLIITPILLLGMAQYIGYKSWTKYPMIILATTLLIFAVTSEGISEKGIYCATLGGGILKHLAKWEDIKTIKINPNNNKLESFKHKTITIFTAQYYKSEEINEIKEYIENKTKI